MKTSKRADGAGVGPGLIRQAQNPPPSGRWLARWEVLSPAASGGGRRPLWAGRGCEPPASLYETALRRGSERFPHVPEGNKGTFYLSHGAETGRPAHLLLGGRFHGGWARDRRVVCSGPSVPCEPTGKAALELDR